jgi:integrase/recombinase XerD
MKHQNVPEPQLISLVGGSKPTTPKPPVPTELSQQRVDEFLAARSLAPKSQKAYREDLARFMAWTDTAWSNVTPRQVAQFKTHLLRNDFKTGKRVLADASAKRILQTFKNLGSPRTPVNGARSSAKAPVVRYQALPNRS